MKLSEIRNQLLVIVNSLEHYKIGFDEEESEWPLLSKEVYLAITSLQQASMWTGNMRKFSGNPCPYINSGTRQTVADIEPTYDEQDGILKFENGGNEITKVYMIDQIREILESMFHSLQGFKAIDSDNGESYDIAYRGAVTDLYKGKSWLGMELKRIREEFGS